MKQSLNRFRLFYLVIPVLLLLLQTGCWSRIEIENQAITVGVALDIGDETKLAQKLKGIKASSSKQDLITATYQVINTEGAAGGRSKGGASQPSYLNISNTGESLHQITREVALRNDKAISGQHLKVIVIGDKLARSRNLRQLLDFYLRDQHIRPSAYVYISNGLAKETLELKEMTSIPTFRLHEIVKNQYRSSRILPPVTLAKLVGKMQSSSSFLLQTVISGDGEIKFSGASVIHGKTGKLIGYLNEEEVEGFIWITGKGKDGLIKGHDEETGQLLVYEITSMKCSIQPHVEKDNISFTVFIKSKGTLSEQWTQSGDPFDNTFLKKAEKALNRQVERLVRSTLEKIQKQYQSDVAGFGEQIRIKYPKRWETLKTNWDKTFSQVPVQLSVNLTIEDFGTAGSAKNE
ncbi:Ger(x)C family spore germination protein [Paenibacillus sp. MBLB4367]|uniref:Ger(x)C family spore germination protein n=1 Tax=Paenibacillus sp. MBLB4367 TaxID=3384767 RepID=UPI0039080594